MTPKTQRGNICDFCRCSKDESKLKLYKDFFDGRVYDDAWLCKKCEKKTGFSHWRWKVGDRLPEKWRYKGSIFSKQMQESLERKEQIKLNITVAGEKK